MEGKIFSRWQKNTSMTFKLQALLRLMGSSGFPKLPGQCEGKAACQCKAYASSTSTLPLLLPKNLDKRRPGYCFLYRRSFYIRLNAGDPHR